MMSRVCSRLSPYVCWEWLQPPRPLPWPGTSSLENGYVASKGPEELQAILGFAFTLKSTTNLDPRLMSSPWLQLPYLIDFALHNNKNLALEDQGWSSFFDNELVNHIVFLTALHEHRNEGFWVPAVQIAGDSPSVWDRRSTVVWKGLFSTDWHLTSLRAYSVQSVSVRGLMNKIRLCRKMRETSQAGHKSTSVICKGGIKEASVWNGSIHPDGTSGFQSLLRWEKWMFGERERLGHSWTCMNINVVHTSACGLELRVPLWATRESQSASNGRGILFTREDTAH